MTGTEVPALTPAQSQLEFLLGQALEAAAFERARAVKAEAELSALGDRLTEAIRTATEAERGRAEAAEAEAARLRALLRGEGHGDSAPELLPPGEAARRLRVHPQTLRALEKTGGLTPVRTPGGSRRYRATEVEEVRRKRAGRDTG